MHKSVGFASHAPLLLEFQCYHLQAISGFGCDCVALMLPVRMDAVVAA